MRPPRETHRQIRRTATSCASLASLQRQRSASGTRAELALNLPSSTLARRAGCGTRRMSCIARWANPSRQDLVRLVPLVQMCCRRCATGWTGCSLRRWRTWEWCGGLTAVRGPHRMPPFCATSPGPSQSLPHIVRPPGSREHAARVALPVCHLRRPVRVTEIFTVRPCVSQCHSYSEPGHPSMHVSLTKHATIVGGLLLPPTHASLAHRSPVD